MFAATNVDDLLLLGVFFSDRKRRRSHVVLGQFLGIGALIAVSLLGSLLALAISPAWIALLGLIPLALGVKALLELRNPSDASDAAAPAGSTIIAVASVTIANGADNLGVYLPLFATLSPAELTLTIASFLILTGVWCASALWLLRHRHIAAGVERIGPVLFPFVLIGLGLWILADALPLVLPASPSSAIGDR